MLLGQSAEHGDRAEADDVLSTWFGEDTPTAFDRALYCARAVVNTAEGWAAIQDVAARLLDAGEVLALNGQASLAAGGPPFRERISRQAQSPLSAKIDAGMLTEP